MDQKEYVNLRQGKYGWVVNNQEILSDTKPDGPSYKYDEAFTLEIKGKN